MERLLAVLQGWYTDIAENDKGVLVDLYIPRHCSATSMSRNIFMVSKESDISRPTDHRQGSRLDPDPGCRC